MFAIVTIAGQQMKVTEGQEIFVHQLEAAEGDNVNFDQVLLVENDAPTISFRSRGSRCPARWRPRTRCPRGPTRTRRRCGCPRRSRPRRPRSTRSSCGSCPGTA